MTINGELQDWTDFYTAVAGIAGVLVGLLFVALALNPAIMSDSSPAGLRVWCSQTFHCLVLTLTFSLLFLIPDPSGLGIGVPIVAVALLGLWQMRVDVRALRSDPDPRWSQPHAALRRFGYVIAAYTMAIAIGASLMLNHAGLIDWMVAPVFLLLINSAINCWYILKDVGNLPHS